MKITTCLIGITLLITSIVMHTQNKDKTIFKNFENLLDEKQKDIYKNIVKERLKIYTMGMILGLSLGAYYIYSNPKDTYLICKFFMIIYTIKLGFYYFYPKQPLMLYSLTNQKQVDAWADIYTEMKERWVKSLFIGLIGYFFLSMYICSTCKRR